MNFTLSQGKTKSFKKTSLLYNKNISVGKIEICSFIPEEKSIFLNFEALT